MKLRIISFSENGAKLAVKRCKSAIAQSQVKICPHAPTTHTQFQTLSARTSARTSHMRKCDNTHMCAATQHLINSETGTGKWITVGPSLLFLDYYSMSSMLRI